MYACERSRRNKSRSALILLKSVLSLNNIDSITNPIYIFLVLTKDASKVEDNIKVKFQF